MTHISKSVFQSAHAFKAVLLMSSVLGLSLFSQLSHAEKADSLQKANINAEYTNFAGKMSKLVLTGSVKLTRGSLLITAEQATSVRDANGALFAVLTGENGKPVTFKQKRDGGPDLWIEGKADRIEYDEKTELVKFINKAHVKYLNGKEVTDEFESAFFSYDSLNDVFIGTNSNTGKRVPGAGVVTITQQAKKAKSEKIEKTEKENQPEGKK
jgi:lipopolysaccharide export system protein LptA